MKTAIFPVLLLLQFAILQPLQLDAEDLLRVAGIQLEIDTELYSSAAQFHTHVEERISEALREGPLDLIIFPEYTGVFFAFFDLPLRKLGINTVEDGIEYLRKRHGVDHIADYFKSDSGRRKMDSIWGPLARQFNTAILAGSYFAVEQHGTAYELRNRALFYDSSGRMLYAQDKVFLTPFESELLGISPGSLPAARPIQYRGYSLAMSLCRDTFFDVWESKFADSDLWIDIKANGELFGPQQELLFQRALPERIEETEVDYGITVCLNGSFLDLLWEGPSTALHVSNTGALVQIDEASTVSGSDIIRLELLN